MTEPMPEAPAAAALPPPAAPTDEEREGEVVGVKVVVRVRKMLGHETVEGTCAGMPSPPPSTSIHPPTNPHNQAPSPVYRWEDMPLSPMNS